MTIFSIRGWEFQLNFHCTRYRKSLQFIFSMLLNTYPKKHCYVACMLISFFYDYIKKNYYNTLMLLSLFYTSQKKRCYVAFMILVLLYDSPNKHCYVACMLLSFFYAPLNNRCYVTLTLPYGSKFSTESLYYLFFKCKRICYAKFITSTI